MTLILRQNEKIIKTAFKHWLFLVPTYLFWLAILAVLFVVRYRTNFDFYGYWNWFVIGIVALSIIWTAVKTIARKKNILWLTNQRVVKSQRKGIFSKSVTELLYKDIVEVSS